jgi:hypothetical protein
MRRTYCWLLAATLLGAIAGCDTSGGEVPRTKDGLVPLPARPGPSAEEQKAAFLKRSQEAKRAPRLPGR